MNVLVTGANGFVGAEVCKKLLAAGHSVRGMVRKTSDLSLLEDIDVSLTFGSLIDEKSMEAAAEGIDVVCHIAAFVSDWGRYEAMYEINVEGTRRLLDKAAEAGCSRFVFISSAAVHSFIDAGDMDEDSPQHDTRYSYCLTKREAENIVMAYHKKGAIEGVVVRPGDVYGPGDRTSLLKMTAMLEKGRLALIDRGEKLGAFTYVENLADAIVLCCFADKAAGEAFVITDGVKMTWQEYFTKLTGELNLPGPRWSVPGPLAAGAAAFLETLYKVLRIKARPPLTRYLVEHLCGDFNFKPKKAKKLLGYTPRVDVDTAIKKTAEWYEKKVRGSG